MQNLDAATGLCLMKLDDGTVVWLAVVLVTTTVGFTTGVGNNRLVGCSAGE